PSINAEDLLSDLDAPAKPAPSKPSAPPPKTDGRLKAPPPSTNARIANPPAAPALPPRGNGTPAGLKMSTPPPTKLGGNGGGRTAGAARGGRRLRAGRGRRGRLRVRRDAVGRPPADPGEAVGLARHALAAASPGRRGAAAGVAKRRRVRADAGAGRLPRDP